MPRQKSAQAAANQSTDASRDVNKIRFHAVVEAAAHSGLLGEKNRRISPTLLEHADNHTGIMADSELIEFVLTTVALDDDLAKPSVNPVELSIPN